MYRKFLVFAGIGISLLQSSCSSSSSSSGVSLAALSSPFALTTSTSSSLSTFKSTRSFQAASFDEREAVLAALEAESSNPDNCTFTIDLARESQYADCYGPNIKQTGTHPDTTAAVPACPSSGAASNPLPSGDTGIWDSTETTTGEACAASQINKLMDYHTKLGYFGQVAGLALKCFVTSSGIAKPVTGSSPPLTAAELTAFSFPGFTASSGLVTAITDGNGVAGYKYTVSGTVTYTEASASVNADFTVRYQYTNESDSGFRGRAAYVIKNSTGSVGGCGSTVGSSRAGSMTFSRADTSSNVRIKLDQAEFCGTTYDPFGSDDTIRPCDKVSQSTDGDAANGWGSNWNRLVFDFNPTTEVGSYAYAWQAGASDSHTRVFNAKKTSDTAGVGYFGFGPAVGTASDTSCTTASTLGAISGMICNWNGAGNSHVPATTLPAYVQKQTLSRASTSAKWGVASEKILYVPMNTCGATGTYAGFTYFAATVTDPAVCPPATTSSGNYTLDSEVATTAGTRFDLETLANYSTDWGTGPVEASF